MKLKGILTIVIGLLVITSARAANNSDVSLKKETRRGRKLGYLPIAGKLILMNLEGQMILEKGIQTESETIDIEQVPAGIYLLEIQDRQGEILVVRKVVKE